MNIISKLFSPLLFFMTIIHKIMGMPRNTPEFNGVTSNGTLKRPFTRSCVDREKSKQKLTESGLANLADLVKNEPENPTILNQTRSAKTEPVNSGPSNQTESVNKGIENSNSEAVEKATEEKGYMRTTQSCSATEKGKAEVEETQDLGKGKEVAEKPKPEIKPAPVIKYHLQWDGTIYDEAMEEAEEDRTCIICEQDLSSSPGDENGYGDEDDEYSYYFETANLPEVGILGCGHCYHTQCVDSITPDDFTADPPCLICLS